MSGNVSSGIEPWAANVFTEQTSKGTFIRKNPELERVLRKMGKNTKEVWDKILADGGSVQDLDFLDDWCFSQGKLVECKEISIDERAHRVILRQMPARSILVVLVYLRNCLLDECCCYRWY